MSTSDKASPEEILASILALESRLADEAQDDAHQELLFTTVERLTQLMSNHEMALLLVLADTQLRRLARERNK